jgi:hypothetical protein
LNQVLFPDNENTRSGNIELFGSLYHWVELGVESKLNGLTGGMAKIHTMLKLACFFQAGVFQRRDGDSSPRADVGCQVDIHSGTWDSGVNAYCETANKCVRDAGGLERSRRVNQGSQLVRLRFHFSLPAAKARDQPSLARAEPRNFSYQ